MTIATQTAQELADDLRRFLDRKPIKARRPSPLDRASRWARQHRKAVATAIALLLTAVVGLSVVVILILQAEKRAVAAKARAVAAEDKAEKHAREEPIRIVDAANPPPPADVPLYRLVEQGLGPRTRGRKTSSPRSRFIPGSSRRHSDGL